MSQIDGLLNFLHTHIPLTKSLGLQIVSIDEEGARIKAPLAPNHNHMGSAFGGSLSTMMILSGYIWLYDQLQKHGHIAHVILAKEEAEYLLPVTADIEVLAKTPSESSWKKFEETFKRKGIARIVISSEIKSSSSTPAALFKGEFVARKS